MDHDPIPRAALVALAEVPPLPSLAAVEAAARVLEECAVRAALEASAWLPARAARYLGLKRRSTMARVLERHPTLAAEVARRRLTANGSTRSAA